MLTQCMLTRVGVFRSVLPGRHRLSEQGIGMPNYLSDCVPLSSPSEASPERAGYRNAMLCIRFCGVPAARVVDMWGKN